MATADDSRQTVPVDEHVFLRGRPPLGQYLGFVTQNAQDGNSVDHRVLGDEWRAANDYIHNLESQEAGLADNPPISPLPPELTPLVEQVTADPIFQRTFSLVPTSVGLVELDHLVVCQKHINLAYVQQIQDNLGSEPTPEDVLRLCLPFHHPHPPFRSRRIAQNAWVFVSPSDDFRFLEPALLNENQISGYSSRGPIGEVIGLIVGYGGNYLNAVYLEDRLVLNNGSHRAYALRELGWTHVPCVIQNVSRREELEVTGPADLLQNADMYVTSPRPPMLKDYFDPKLRKIVSVPRKLREIKVTFAVEQVDIPA